MTWNDGSWDTLYLDGQPLPGRLVKLTITPKRDVKVEKPKGADSFGTKDEGYQGATVDVELELWRAAQVLTLSDMLSKLSPRQPGGLSSPHTLSHPLATLANVTKVYSFEHTLQMPVKGRMIIPIKMHEWLPAVKVKTNQSKKPPKELTTGGNFGQPPDQATGLQGRVTGTVIDPHEGAHGV